MVVGVLDDGYNERLLVELLEIWFRFRYVNFDSRVASVEVTTVAEIEPPSVSMKLVGKSIVKLSGEVPGIFIAGILKI